MGLGHEVDVHAQSSPNQSRLSTFWQCHWRMVYEVDAHAQSGPRDLLSPLSRKPYVRRLLSLKERTRKRRKYPVSGRTCCTRPAQDLAGWLAWLAGCWLVAGWLAGWLVGLGCAGLGWLAAWLGNPGQGWPAHLRRQLRGWLASVWGRWLAGYVFASAEDK